MPTIGLVRFGVFELDANTGQLSGNGIRVRLSRQPLQVLCVLLERPGEVVLREELHKLLWSADVFVDFDHGLNKSIQKLREALGDSPESPRYIETIPRTGYRFLAPVTTTLDWVPAGSGLSVQDLSAAGGRSSGRTNSEKTEVRTDRRRKFMVQSGIVIAAISGLLLFLTIRYMRPKRPVVSDIVRLTNDRKAKIPIEAAETDGLHLYFMEGQPWESGSGIAQVSAMGGETTWITTSLKEALEILDISPDKSKLLLLAVGGSGSDEFWVQPLPAGTPRRLGNLKASTADWTPDGAHIIYCYQHKIGIVNEDGSDPHTIAEIPGSAAWFRYSPDGRLIRFSLQDMGNANSIWEMRADGTNLHQLLPNWKESLNQYGGRWSPDGKYYYFLTSQGIWVMPERRSIFRQDMTPTRLTTGPFRFGAPTLSSDGKRIFAVGSERRVELFSYDPHARRFDSYLGGLSAGPVAFSPDGKWLAYVSYPEMTLWKSRTDLSEKIQLTFPPVRAFAPRWSPDGSQIAFWDAQLHRPSKVYLVSASGGDPKQIAPSNIDDADGDPTWTSDGKSIIFARAPAGERSRQAIYRIDLSSGNLTLIPGSNRLFSPRISPDGRHIAALTEDARQLMLLDQATNSWSTLAEGGYFGFNEWSPDGKYVYARQSRGGFAVIVRVRIKDRLLEDILSLKDVPEVVDPFAAWYGLTSDGKLLLMRDRSVEEIYALDLQEK